MKKKIIWTVILLLLGAGIYWIVQQRPAETPGGRGEGRRGPGAGGRPVPVQAAAAKSGDVEVLVNAIGTVTARNTAVVKVRVDGQLTAVSFTEGQAVREGDVLAQIDPRPYQVTLDQANGQLARDQALLANAKIDLERYRGLLAKDSIARQQVDAQEALVRQYEGTVQSDRAQVDNAKLQLGFTRVTAPIAGRTGLRLVDVGNMVRGSDATGIATITQTQPITAVFAIPGDHVPALMAKLRAGEKLAVEAHDRDGKTRLASGRLLTADNQIDVATGTVKLKAVFANNDEALFPNQFVNIRLRLETRRDAVLVPTAAIQRGTQGTFVHVVGAEGVVSLRPVTLGPVSGELVAIEKGLAVGEQVVTDGADKLREGGKVEVTTPGAAAAPGAAGARGPGGNLGGTPEERQKRWAELNARIDKGEFGEEIKKLPEEERKKKMRELRGQNPNGGAPGAAPNAPATTRPEPAAAALTAVPPAPTFAAPANGGPPAGAPGGGFGGTPEERQKRWAELNARIDKGEFGEEIRKLPEEERKLKMRELRRQREAAGQGQQ